MVQTWWQKLNANERMAATGAIVVFIVALLGTSWLALIGSAAVLAIYWLKYSPNKITWPAPVELITVVISGIIALFAVIGLLFALGIGSFGFGMLGAGGGFFGGIYLLIVASAIAFIVGAGMMFLGTWREYQAMPKSAAPGPPSAPPSAPPPPPSAPPSEPPSAPPSEPPSA
jgi:hypothetical protein